MASATGIHTPVCSSHAENTTALPARVPRRKRLSRVISGPARSAAHPRSARRAIDCAVDELDAPVPGRLREELASAGIPPQAVETVVVTHIHTDHIG